MQVRPFTVEDWYAIKDPVEPFAPTGTDASLFDTGYAVTVYDGDTVLGCGGIIPDGDDKAYIWLRLSSVAAMTLKQSLQVFSIVKDCFKILVETYELEEVYSYVLDGFKKGEKFAKLMGFDICGEVEIEDKKYRYIRYRRDWE